MTSSSDLPWLRVLGTAVLAMGLAPPLVAAPDSVKAIAPVQGIVTGPRPLFRFGISSAWDDRIEARIELSRTQWKTIEKAWDTRESARGWSLSPGEGDEDPPGGRLRSPELLPEGAWEWRVRIVRGDGSTDVAKPAAFKVDATPPAEVSTLRVERRADGAIVLSWEPVLFDVEGRPETVDRYAVYRYDVREIFEQPQASVLGETRGLNFIDRQPLPPSPVGVRRKAGRAPIEPPAVNLERSTLYYKVVAVDSAGNELGRRDDPTEESDPLPRTPVPSTPSAP